MVALISNLDPCWWAPRNWTDVMELRIKNIFSNSIYLLVNLTPNLATPLGTLYIIYSYLLEYIWHQLLHLHGSYEYLSKNTDEDEPHHHCIEHRPSWNLFPLDHKQNVVLLCQIHIQAFCIKLLHQHHPMNHHKWVESLIIRFLHIYLAHQPMKLKINEIGFYLVNDFFIFPLKNNSEYKNTFKIRNASDTSHFMTPTVVSIWMRTIIDVILISIASYIIHDESWFKSAIFWSGCCKSVSISKHSANYWSISIIPWVITNWSIVYQHISFIIIWTSNQ